MRRGIVVRHGAETVKRLDFNISLHVASLEPPWLVNCRVRLQPRITVHPRSQGGTVNPVSHQQQGLHPLDDFY